MILTTVVLTPYRCLHFQSHALQKMSKKFFVLHSTSSSGPARFDYYDNEKKFKGNNPPKKSIHLHTCFNINKKVDSKHKFGISIFLGTECFAVAAESEPDQDDWLGLLLKFQNEYLLDGEAPKTHYGKLWSSLEAVLCPASEKKGPKGPVLTQNGGHIEYMWAIKNKTKKTPYIYNSLLR